MGQRERETGGGEGREREREREKKKKKKGRKEGREGGIYIYMLSAVEGIVQKGNGIESEDSRGVQVTGSAFMRGESE